VRDLAHHARRAIITNAAAAREAGLNLWIVGQGGAVS
jgi:hypothetical protein